MRTLNTIACIGFLLFVCVLKCECSDMWKMSTASYYSRLQCEAQCCCGDTRCEPTRFVGRKHYKCVIGTFRPGCSSSLESPTNGDVIIRGSLFGLQYDVGAQAIYSCDQGYTLVGGTHSRQCDVDGTWSGSAPQCEPIVCPVPSNPVNGDYSLSDGRNFESRADFTCDENYSLKGLPQLVCMSNGNWSGSSPVCEPTGCVASLTSPTKGDVRLVGLPSTLRYEVGSTATYSCDQGYTLVGGTNPRQCEIDSTWSGDAPTCEPIICQELFNPANGDVTLSMGRNFESTAEYTCDDTYTLIGLPQLVCMSNGYWSGSSPKCERTICSELFNPANGDVHFSMGRNVESMAQFTCDDTYTLIGLSQLVCLSNGYWSGPSPTCTRTTCGALFSPAYGTISLSNGNLVESIATFTCDVGYLMMGLSQLVCLSSGAWSGSSPTCLIADCGSLQAPSGGSMNISGTSVGDEATFACDDGLTLMGSATRECLANGMWSGETPYCVSEDCPEEFDEEDYPTVMEEGVIWQLFWWYNSTGGWPTYEDDTLGTPFGCCNPEALHCFGRMPQYLIEDQTELLAIDSGGTKFRWQFNSSEPTAHGAWLAFHDHQQTANNVIRHQSEWFPSVVAGGPYVRVQDSWMYREENGVVSFILDDDNCDCYSTLNAGHAMCHDGFDPQWNGVLGVYGVGLLNENGCVGPSAANSLFLYYADTSVPDREAS